MNHHVFTLTSLSLIANLHTTEWTSHLSHSPWNFLKLKAVIKQGVVQFTKFLGRALDWVHYAAEINLWIIAVLMPVQSKRTSQFLVVLKVKNNVSESHCGVLCIMFFTETHGLSFLETSALDSTNVEQAFHTILTGEFPHLCLFLSAYVKS